MAIALSRGMFLWTQIAATAASTPMGENEPLTAIALALLISLGLGTAAVGAMLLNRSVTRAWIRFHRSRKALQDEGWQGEEPAEVLAD